MTEFSPELIPDAPDNPEESESRKRVQLSDIDITRIHEINSRIVSISPEVIEASEDDIIVSLENGHPLNRLIRNDEGQVSAYMACVDSNDNQEVHVKYLASDGTIADFNAETEKLFKRAKKLGYEKISFNGANPVLNRFLIRKGFVRANDQSNNPWERYEKFITNEHAEKTRAWMQYLKEQAPDVMNKLGSEEEEYLKVLLKKTSEQHLNPKIEDLYGALYNLQLIGLRITECSSIKKIYEMANEVQTRSECADALIELLGKERTNTKLKNSIMKVMVSTDKQKWSSELKTLLHKKKIKYPHDFSFTYTYLKSFSETKREVTSIGSFTLEDYPTKSLQVVELTHMIHLKKETDALDHCVGKSSTYIDQIKKGAIHVFSLRDENGNPKYTLEYDPHSSTIKQFAGKNNELPEDDEVVIGAFTTLEKAGFPILHCAEKFNFLIWKDVREDHVVFGVEEDLLTNPSSEDYSQREVIGGTIIVDPSISKEALQKICKTQGIIIDATELTNERREEIISVAGTLRDDGAEYDGSVLYENLEYIGESLDVTAVSGVFGSYSFPKLKTIKKNIDADNFPGTLTFGSLEELGGEMNIDRLDKLVLDVLTEYKYDLLSSELITLHAPKLKRVRNIILSNARECILTDLEEVEQEILLEEVRELDMSSLRKVTDGLSIGLSYKVEFPLLEYVGLLEIQGAMYFSAPKLIEINDNVIAPSVIEFEAPSLRRVTEDLTFEGPIEKISLDSLELIGGDLYVRNTLKEITIPDTCMVTGTIIYSIDFDKEKKLKGGLAELKKLAEKEKENPSKKASKNNRTPPHNHWGNASIFDSFDIF